ncbi:MULTISPECIES: epoxide hydrolase family protein [Bacillus]|uniref:epoxide hydrolase family protein n=1 Tax=Bacillus TaxID=1386 RepID=UPI0013D7D6C5|nr:MULTISPECIES: epoxide hydrolase family protein [Bacillus]MCE7037865.1 epoxide hydrolase [Bacillus cereus]MDX9636782.1 epoxide hydrolase [Bacillus sp. PBL-C9]
MNKENVNVTSEKAKELKTSIPTPRPFNISIDQVVLDNLQQRISQTRWPDRIEESGWSYGTDDTVLRKLVHYWKNEFDWRAQERELNQLPHYMVTIDGIDIHFIHLRGKGTKTTPLLMLHGWPSTFVQMTEIAPYLADPVRYGGRLDQAFDVVIPSLPGFGFSGKPTESGMDLERIGEIFSTLMTKVLGYKRFVGRGSDMGQGVLMHLAKKYPEQLIGLHFSGTNLLIDKVPENISKAEEEFIANSAAWMQTEWAYAFLQSTKPQTVAVALNDSPTGLASWIIEKFHTWTDNPEKFITRYGIERLLTNLTIYWVTETIASSMRLYAECTRSNTFNVEVEVPTSMLMAGYDMFPMPREWAERSINVVRWVQLDRGGHFLEWEEPALVTADLREAFCK